MIAYTPLVESLGLGLSLSSMAGAPAPLLGIIDSTVHAFPGLPEQNSAPSVCRGTAVEAIAGPQAQEIGTHFGHLGFLFGGSQPILATENGTTKNGTSSSSSAYLLSISGF